MSNAVSSKAGNESVNDIHLVEREHGQDTIAGKVFNANALSKLKRLLNKYNHLRVVSSLGGKDDSLRITVSLGNSEPLLELEGTTFAMKPFVTFIGYCARSNYRKVVMLPSDDGIRLEITCGLASLHEREFTLIAIGRTNEAHVRHYIPRLIQGVRIEDDEKFTERVVITRVPATA